MLAALLSGMGGCGNDDQGTNTGDGLGGTAKHGADLGEAVGEQTTLPPSTSTTGPALPVRTLPIRSVAVPAEAPVGNDFCGNPTTFGAANLFDGVVDTAWRMAGDATGEELTITLDGSHDIREVGLVPGYAKVDTCDGSDRFPQNRRVLKVTWLFDDGTTVSQDLRDASEMQSVGVTATSSTIRMRIEAVTEPGGRDFTAVSELGVRGN